MDKKLRNILVCLETAERGVDDALSALSLIEAGNMNQSCCDDLKANLSRLEVVKTGLFGLYKKISDIRAKKSKGETDNGKDCQYQLLSNKLADECIKQSFDATFRASPFKELIKDENAPELAKAAAYRAYMCHYEISEMCQELIRMDDLYQRMPSFIKEKKLGDV